MSADAAVLPVNKDRTIDAIGRAVVPAPEGSVLSVRVTPRAGSTRIAGLRDGALLVRLAAPPVDGAANEALIALLAKVFALPARSITISSGTRGRNKRIILRAHPESVRRRLVELLAEQSR